MRTVTILFLIIAHLSSFAQLSTLQKLSFAGIKKSDKILIAYAMARSLEEKQNTIVWATKKVAESNDPKQFIELELLKARLLKEKGQYLESKKLLESTIEYFEHSNIVVSTKDYANNYDSYLAIYDELAEIYLFLGNFSKATIYYEKSSILRKRTFKKNDIFQLGPVIGLAKINYLQGNLDIALQQFTECKHTLLSAVQGKDSPNEYYRDVYLMSASIHLEQNSPKDALKNAKIGEGLFASSSVWSPYGIDNLARIEAQGLIAEIYIAQDDQKNGKKWLDKAFDTFNKFYTTELNEYSQLLKVKARLHILENRTSAAYLAVEEMMDNHLNFLNNNFSSLSEKEKADFYDRVNEDLSYYFFVSFATYAEKEDAAILEAIVNLRMETKGFILNNQNKIKSAILNSGDITLIDELQNWQNAKELLAYELFSDPRGFKTDSLRLVINDMERTLSTKTKLITSSNQNLLINDLRMNLKKNETAIELIRYINEDEDKVNLVALIIEPNDIKLIQSSIKSEEEERTIKYYRNAIQYELNDERSYSILWENIDNQLSGIEKVYFSPDGIYNQINVNTLYRPKEDNYVLDSYQVINMTNLKDLLNKQNEEYELSVSLFGRPQYDYTSEVANYFNNESDLTLRSNLFLELEGFQEQEFSDLPGTAKEILSISSTMNNYGWDVSEFIGPTATEQQVKLVDNTGILHIATHGFFLEGAANVNPMIKSGLVMAGVNNKGQTIDDGVLTAYEATNLKLDNTWLVVLSACETGLGDVKNGEGVYGLQRALTVAGAANLMMTLWKVDDDATKELMIDFYNQLGNGILLEDAFRNSQLSLRDKYPHPKYWGAFVLVKAKG